MEDYNKRYDKIAKSEWFKKAYVSNTMSAEIHWRFYKLKKLVEKISKTKNEKN